MLVLSRRKDERIMIGDNIVIEVVEIRGDKVRLSFIAPPEVTIHREEIYLLVQQERRDAGRNLNPPTDDRS